MKFFVFSLFILIFISSSLKADEAADWLKIEIDNIINAYKDSNISKIERFNYIEDAINKNFASAGIAKFVAGKSWSVTSDKNVKKKYISLFKRHLALNIASMMQGYSNQEYSLLDSKFDQKNSVSLINMEIKSDTSSLVITWRVKKSKERFFVIDLLVADISLVITKRAEFNSILKREDYDLKSFNAILESQNILSYSKIIQ